MIFIDLKKIFYLYFGFFSSSSIFFCIRIIFGSFSIQIKIGKLYKHITCMYIWNPFILSHNQLIIDSTNIFSKLEILESFKNISLDWVPNIKDTGTQIQYRFSKSDFNNFIDKMRHLILTLVFNNLDFSFNNKNYNLHPI